MDKFGAELYKDIFEQLNFSAIITDENKTIISVNAAYLSLSGCKKDEMLNKQIELFFADTYDELRDEIVIKTNDGREILQQLIVNPIKVENHSFQIWLMTDYQVSGLDPLTKLPNRFLLSQKIDKAIQKARTEGAIFAVLFLDLDRFKFVNDTLGHSYGDLLLKEAANRIKTAIGHHNVIARMGGDEFVCVLEDIRDEKEAEQYAKKILEAFSTPYLLNETVIYVTTSVGISTFPYDGDEVEMLITNADSAMYVAKKKGRNQYEMSNADISAGGFEKLLIENNLRRALENDELSLYFQPQVNLKSNRIMSMEALLRWKHPDLGMILPGEFIPIAEETGLILPIGDWVIRTACHKMKEWQDDGYPPIRVAVNLSAGQFLQNDLVEKIRNVLTEVSLDPTYLELEITENMVMQDVHKAIDVLQQLKELGVWISIDDFGTGYSSLNYLKDFPVDTLKIDRSFIYDIDKNPSSVALTKAITTLAHDLKLKVIAEGVENYKQLSMVKQFSCDVVQGYYFSQPLSYDHVVRYLNEYQSSKVNNA
ncbi:sensor domain-containing protein [Ferdinandcohnia quinoae]|uniref:EAL domain-containing protein n=1 Tax=Fredinandcohnia quinoae TaxID=2918902 RepID=A0AAW5E9E4_9BACI|nr:EAL domain-containing protein [Fredinandcohnia sp. SECRCQ15]MCH1626512.1 EAL domain-containing protein [Fredinandcohnia sp. SECRCQ15]